MPLSAAFEKLLGFVPDAEREGYRKALQENEENGLRQSEFSRKMNELAKQREASESQHKTNLEWYNKASAEYKAIKGDLQAKEARLAELESARRESDPLTTTFEDDARQTAELRRAQAEAADAKLRVSQLETKLTDIDKMFQEGKVLTREQAEKALDNFGASVLDIVDLQSDYQAQFGKRLDRQTLIDEAQRWNGDLKQAYKVITEKDREEKRVKDLEVAYEQKFQERLKAANLPMDTAQPPPSSVGPLQQFLQKKGSSIPDDVPADNSGRLAGLIAKELIAEGKY